MNSPFEYKIVDGCLIRINRENNCISGRIELTDTEKLCDFITKTDESLWDVRAILNQTKQSLELKIERAQEALK